MNWPDPFVEQWRNKPKVLDMAERQIAQTHAQIRAMSGERRTWK